MRAICKWITGAYIVVYAIALGGSVKNLSHFLFGGSLDPGVLREGVTVVSIPFVQYFMLMCFRVPQFSEAV